MTAPGLALALPPVPVTSSAVEEPRLWAILRRTQASCSAEGPSLRVDTANDGPLWQQVSGAGLPPRAVSLSTAGIRGDDVPACWGTSTSTP